MRYIIKNNNNEYVKYWFTQDGISVEWTTYYSDALLYYDLFEAESDVELLKSMNIQASIIKKYS